MDHPAATGRTTVLVVDDSPEDRELFAYVLRKAGHRVLEANGAREAQRLTGEEGKIDLLVTDFNMPEMNGVELARWFRSRSPGSKVLLLSGAPWQLEAFLEATGWPAFLDKLLAEMTPHVQGFGPPESVQWVAAGAMAQRDIVGGGSQAGFCA